MSAHRSDHLLRARAADLFVDSFGYNAHTTSVDALWAGVAVLTLAGEPMKSRLCAAVLHAAGLERWLVARTEAEYEELMARLANRGLGGALRAEVQRRQGSRLFDAPGFVRELAVGIHAATELRLLGRTNMHLQVHPWPGVGDARAVPTEQSVPTEQAAPTEQAELTERAEEIEQAKLMGAPAQGMQFELWTT